MKHLLFVFFLIAITALGFCDGCTETTLTPHEYALYQMRCVDAILNPIEDEGYESINNKDFFIGYCYGKREAYYKMVKVLEKEQ